MAYQRDIEWRSLSRNSIVQVCTCELYVLMRPLSPFSKNTQD